MFRRFLLAIALLFFASGILITSILRTALPSYASSQGSVTSTDLNASAQRVDYYLAYPGILPDHFLWPIKSARDNIWLFLTTDPLKKAELYLLLSDKGIGASQVLIEGGKGKLAVNSAQQAGKYLQEALKSEEIARNKGVEVSGFLDRLALASLKHREKLQEMEKSAPEDLRNDLSRTIEYSKKVFEELKGIFNYIKKPLPESTFVD